MGTKLVGALLVAALATRLRLFHQSSHLGDEYMVHTNARRIDLTFQAVELLVATEMSPWRVYGGGDYVFAHSPTDLKPGVLHGGLEFRQARSYTGPAPYGEFYRDHVSSVGVGVGFTL